ncbi:thiamine-binding protein [Mahella sp.]|uniref:thiamine-binding protein n=1 Tax=Mahella sp. TaxID=2798721 RepID=UPI0025C6020A|nr:thiamine-binding protein [Mahella sp.]MBZ4665208.1 hypothetical protein [Mahella sp.]MDK2903671.1 hypothetical protein [Clostridiales bacterium]
MNTLIAVAIAPFGIGDELAPKVAEVIKVIRDSGLPYHTTSMFTEIEGEWDEVMKVIKDATFVLADKGIRTEVVLKADVRPGYTNMMTEKVNKINDILGEENNEYQKKFDIP